MSDFVSRYGLWSGTQEEAAADIAERIAKLGTVRFAFSDAHGVVRGKTLIAADAIGALRSGVTCTLTMLLKDLSGRTAFPVFQRGGNGAGDMVMVADPTTFRVPAVVAAQRLDPVRPLRNGRHAASLLHARADAARTGPAR